MFWDLETVPRLLQVRIRYVAVVNFGSIVSCLQMFMLAHWETGGGVWSLLGITYWVLQFLFHLTMQFSSILNRLVQSLGEIRGVCLDFN